MSEQEKVAEEVAEQEPVSEEAQEPETEPEAVEEPEETAEGEGEEPEEVEPKSELIPGEPVEVSSLPTLQLFQYKRRIYGKHRVHSGGVTCVSKEGDKVLTLPPDTMVKPME